MKKVTIGLGIIVLLIGLLMTLTHVSPLSWGWYQPVNASSGLALGGYDPVSYHVSGGGTPGDEQFNTEWLGAEWRFTSAENLELFTAAQERYAPQFGGNCAQAVSMGMTAKGDPDVWHMEDGRLYVFFIDKAKQDWLRELPNGVVQKSHDNWTNR